METRGWSSYREWLWFRWIVVKVIRNGIQRTWKISCKTAAGMVIWLLFETDSEIKKSTAGQFKRGKNSWRINCSFWILAVTSSEIAGLAVLARFQQFKSQVHLLFIKYSLPDTPSNMNELTNLTSSFDLETFEKFDGSFKVLSVNQLQQSKANLNWGLPLSSTQELWREIYQKFPSHLNVRLTWRHPRNPQLIDLERRGVNSEGFMAWRRSKLMLAILRDI